jgi:hypothetical protein
MSKQRERARTRKRKRKNDGKVHYILHFVSLCTALAPSLDLPLNLLPRVIQELPAVLLPQPANNFKEFVDCFGGVVNAWLLSGVGDLGPGLCEGEREEGNVRRGGKEGRKGREGRTGEVCSDCSAGMESCRARPMSD